MGEGRNGRVRSGWGQITFWLPFAVFLTSTIMGCMYSLVFTLCGGMVSFVTSVESCSIGYDL